MTEEHPSALETKILQLLRHEDRNIRDFGATIAPRIFPDSPHIAPVALHVLRMQEMDYGNPPYGRILASGLGCTSEYARTIVDWLDAESDFNSLDESLEKPLRKIICDADATVISQLKWLPIENGGDSVVGCCYGEDEMFHELIVERERLSRLSNGECWDRLVGGIRSSDIDKEQISLLTSRLSDGEDAQTEKHCLSLLREATEKIECDSALLESLVTICARRRIGEAQDLLLVLLKQGKIGEDTFAVTYTRIESSPESVNRLYDEYSMELDRDERGEIDDEDGSELDRSETFKRGLAFALSACPDALAGKRAYALMAREVYPCPLRTFNPLCTQILELCLMTHLSDYCVDLVLKNLELSRDVGFGDESFADEIAVWFRAMELDESVFAEIERMREHW